MSYRARRRELKIAHNPLQLILCVALGLWLALGGTAAWAELLVPRPIEGLPEGMVGYQIARPAKACLSYVIGAVGHGHPGQRHRLRQRRRSVVQARQQVAMQIDHVVLVLPA